LNKNSKNKIIKFHKKLNKNSKNTMEIKINKENIIEHNKHILAVSGGDFAVLNKGDLDFAIDSVNNETNPLNQATNFLYYGANGHFFEAGNKRTAFEIAKGIMASGSMIIEAPQEEIINFVTGSIAQGKANREDVRVWLSSNSKPINEKPEFNEVTSKNIEKDKKLLKRLD
jgi:prophage maintenance system killer protein